MWQRPTGLSIIAALSTCLPGCSLLLHPAESNTTSTQMSMDELEELKTHFVASDGIVPQFNPSQLKAGQHVKIMTDSPPQTFPQAIEMILFSGIVGTVKEVSADHIVLQDVVMISAKPIQQGVPVASKVPYFGKRFKNTGVRREVTPVPGEVAIELSKILDARELTDAAFADVRKYGVERIGVDFDFSAEGET